MRVKALEDQLELYRSLFEDDKKSHEERIREAQARLQWSCGMSRDS